MPVFEIGLDDGRKLHIEADDQASALAGVQHFQAQQQASSTGPAGLVNAARQGASNFVGGVGETLNQYVGGGGDGLKAAADKIAPANYDASNASLIDRNGIHLDNLGQAVAENAPGAAAGIAAARLTPGSPLLKLLAGGAVYAGSMLGNRAKERAAERTGDTNATPSTADKLVAAGAMVPEAALGSVGISRFLPGSGKVASVGMNGVVDAARRFATTAATEAATAGGQDVVAQAGRTIGTPGGLNIDPYEAANASATGGVVGGTLASGRGVREAKDAVKYRALGAFDPADVSAFANRVQSAAGDDNLNDTRVGYRAHSAATADVANELNAAIAGIRQRNPDLPVEADNALARAASGPFSADDLNSLTAAAPKDPALASLRSLIAQRDIANAVADTGRINNADGTFTGGLSSRMERLSGAVRNKALFGLTGEAFFAPWAIPHTAALLGAAGGAYGLARANDAFSGARSPAGYFADRFSDPSVPVRPSAPAPAAPSGVSPTGPKIPLLPTPWGTEAPAEAPVDTKGLRVNAALEQGMARIAQRLQADQRKKAVTDTLPLLAELARRNAPAPAPQPAPASAPAVPPPSLAAQALAKVQAAQPEAPVQPSPPIAPQNGNLLAQLVASVQAEEAARGSKNVPQSYSLDETFGPKPAADDGLGIPDFLRRDKMTITKSEGEPAKKQSAFAAGEKITDTGHLTPEQYADEQMKKNYAGGEGIRLNPVVVRNATIRRQAEREALALSLSHIAPEIGDQQWFNAWLQDAHDRTTARAKIDRLKEGLDGTRRTMVTQLFSQKVQEAIWRHANAPAQKTK